MASKGKPSSDQMTMFTSLPEQVPPLKIPPINTDWKPPESLPDLKQETEVSIDIETRDPSLANNKGPGSYLYEKANPRTGFICGISVAWRDNSIYIPLRHPETSCFEYSTVRNWLNHLASQNETRFIFHNFQYDWGWIEAVFNIPPPYLLDDTLAMASMVDENLAAFDLDFLCKWQGLPGKDETILNQILGKKGKAELWQLPAKYVGSYAEMDARSTLYLAQRLRPILFKEKLDEAYQTERDLMPITLTMKERGIRVDTTKAREV